MRSSIISPLNTPHLYPKTHIVSHNKTQPTVRQNRYATPTPKPIQPMLPPQNPLQTHPSLPKPQPRTRIPHSSLWLLLFLPIPRSGRRPPKPNPHLRVPHPRYRSRLQRRLLLLLLLRWWCRVAGSDGSGHRFRLLWPRVRGVGVRGGRGLLLLCLVLQRQRRERWEREIPITKSAQPQMQQPTAEISKKK